MPEIIIGTLPNCQPCKLTKRRMDRRGLKYVEVSLTDSDELATVVEAHGYKQAPVVLVTTTGESWSGFRPERVDAL